LSSRSDLFRTALAERVLVADGAMGTELMGMHLREDDFGGAAYLGCNEALVLSRPDLVRIVHERYFEAGADDYLTKPFSFDLLFARVRAVGRRGPIPQPVELTAADLCLNQSSREVRRGGELLYLTKTEYSMLELLMRSAGRVVERESLIASIWGADTDIESNTLDAFVRLLRAKVERPDEPRLIHTVRGVGYRFTEA